jgi:hypothetical protein
MAVRRPPKSDRETPLALKVDVEILVIGNLSVHDVLDGKRIAHR